MISFFILLITIFRIFWVPSTTIPFMHRPLPLFVRNRIVLFFNDQFYAAPIAGFTIVGKSFSFAFRTEVATGGHNSCKL